MGVVPAFILVGSFYLLNFKDSLTLLIIKKTFTTYTGASHKRQQKIPIVFIEPRAEK
jgi:hypothetical protein